MTRLLEDLTKRTKSSNVYRADRKADAVGFSKSAPRQPQRLMNVARRQSAGSATAAPRGFLGVTISCPPPESPSSASSKNNQPTPSARALCWSATIERHTTRRREHDRRALDLPGAGAGWGKTAGRRIAERVHPTNHKSAGHGRTGRSNEEPAWPCRCSCTSAPGGAVAPQLQRQLEVAAPGRSRRRSLRRVLHGDRLHVESLTGVIVNAAKEHEGDLVTLSFKQRFDVLPKTSSPRRRSMTTAGSNPEPSLRRRRSGRTERLSLNEICGGAARAIEADHQQMEAGGQAVIRRISRGLAPTTLAAGSSVAEEAVPRFLPWKWPSTPGAPSPPAPARWRRERPWVGARASYRTGRWSRRRRACLGMKLIAEMGEALWASSAWP